MPGTCVVLVFLISCLLIVPSNQFLFEENTQPEPQPSTPNESDPANESGSYNSSATNGHSRKTLNSNSPMSVAQFRTSVPMRIYECLRDYSTMRCTKLFVLQKLERKNWVNTGNLTKDFLNQFFGEEERMGSLVTERLRKLSDKDINKKLVVSLQRFFKDRDIRLQFLPGLMVKIIPNKENKLKFSLKKKSKYQHHNEARSQDSSMLTSIHKDKGLLDNSGESHVINSLEDDDIDGKSKIKGSKHKKIKKDKISYKSTILQMAVPVMMMPAILMGTFLPFILPVLKMATLTTMIMNNTAFMAALIYAARTHVNAQQEQPINYSYGGHPIGYH
ncbi:uncharacterized protein LOC106084252 [Stomoxys calcitrans]|uniref:Uncharacterized protein n=1 Tax=Stomoxys calcitrans TaxID=35570 RepID=A0A1I8NQK0_STOCA|nr:uncharacterized protein LOC106084252 [Stomoxys calcitrans]